MAKLAAIPGGQHRDQFVVFPDQRRVGIDIEDFEVEVPHPRLGAQRFEGGAHVLAQVAPAAAVEPQPGHGR